MAQLWKTAISKRLKLHTSIWAHFKELRLFFKMSPISSIRLEDTNLQTWGWWTKSFPWFAWIFVILGGPWFLWKYRWAMKTISAHAGDGISKKKLVPGPFFKLDLPTLVTASWRRNKTRPDTRQSSRGWLGRSGNAKTARNSTKFVTDVPTYRPTNQHSKV